MAERNALRRTAFSQLGLAGGTGNMDEGWLIGFTSYLEIQTLRSTASPTDTNAFLKGEATVLPRRPSLTVPHAGLCGYSRINSTRRLRARPATVSFDSFGWVAPNPCGSRRAGSILYCVTRACLTAAARRLERSRL